MIPGLKSMPRGQQQILLVLAGLLLMGLAFLYVIQPIRGREVRVREALERRLQDNQRAIAAIRGMPEMAQTFTNLAASLALETNRYLLRPVLGSYPIQREIYRLAGETAFKVSMVRELGTQATPREIKAGAFTAAQKLAAKGRKGDAKQAAPPPSFARFVVEVVGEGSYADVIALVERLEMENPYCGLTALNIRGVGNFPERHRVSMTIEWPVLADPPKPSSAMRAARRQIQSGP